MRRAGANGSRGGTPTAQQGMRMMMFPRGFASVRRAMMVGVAGIVAAGMPAAALCQAAPPTTNDSADTVGPEQLRNFSLGGNKTQAEPTPAPAVRPDLITPRAIPGRPRSEPRAVSNAPPASTAPARNAPARTPAPVAETPSAVAPPIARPVVPVTAQPVPSQGGGAAGVTVALPPANPLATRPTPANEADIPRISSQPMGANAPLQSAWDGDSDFLPWVIALLLGGGALLAYLMRSRLRREPLVETGPIALPTRVEPRSFPPPPAPPPPPPQRPPEPAPPLARVPLVGGITVKRPNAFEPTPPTPAPPPPPRPGGIVSTRLRPWLELELEPTRAVIDEAQASVQFDVFVSNSGNAPARQVLVEACMVNAGPEQDSELRRFFEAPVGAGDRIDAIPPLGRVALNSTVSLPLDQVRAYEVNGRRLFVPLVAFNALYEWSGGTGQNSASFILGRATSASDGEGDSDSRMAPLRLDLGPRIFRGLDSRRHPLALRR